MSAPNDDMEKLKAKEGGVSQTTAVCQRNELQQSVSDSMQLQQSVS